MILELRNMSKYYGDLALFDKINLKVEKNDFYLISGASGKGKSTLLNIIALLDPHYAGTLIIKDIRNPRIGTKRAKHLLKNDIGYLFQNYGLLESETIFTNFKVVGIKDEKLILKTLKTLGICKELNTLVHTLSGGEQQRLALAKIIIKDPEIILCDEPTGSLDNKNRDFVLNVLKTMHQEGKTIIIVSHDPIVRQMATKIFDL